MCSQNEYGGGLAGGEKREVILGLPSEPIAAEYIQLSQHTVYGVSYLPESKLDDWR